MDWTRPIDAYCERLDAGYWAEPVNAVTNAAFMLAAFVMWRRLDDARLPLARLLVGVLAAIGVGSFLFHTHAQAWAAMADVVPILCFVLIYIYAANRGFWRMGRVAALFGTVVAVALSAALVPLLALIPVAGASAGYLPLPLLIAGYGLALRGRAPQTARNLLLGSGLLVASLTMRSIDGLSCALIPMGTHFGWHLLNALMLGWMIELYRRHMLAPPEPRR
ncbi:MAG: ceramidase domain-containing protein [Pseudomonadota bacterium]|uniref:ceramidase domain-containing protein n=1 Tax=Roseovarius TaxID=74030 RepID=UPI0022A8391E|nr:ceramidase domain-containing protein [Roseovarius sp. EGI FJ00037]MCZ0812808.1 ceramidase domain-containing protein [Roseovarius sp. EGI FJ00037]